MGWTDFEGQGSSIDLSQRLTSQLHPERWRKEYNMFKVNSTRKMVSYIKYNANINRIKVKALADLNCDPDIAMNMIIERGARGLDDHIVSSLATVLYVETQSTDKFRVFNTTEHWTIRRVLNKWFDVQFGTVARRYNDCTEQDGNRWMIFSRLWGKETDRRIRKLKTCFDIEFWASSIRCDAKLLDVYSEMAGDDVDKFKLLENIKKFEMDRVTIRKKEVMKVVNG